MADYRVVPARHTFRLDDDEVIAQTIFFFITTVLITAAKMIQILALPLLALPGANREET